MATYRAGQQVPLESDRLNQAPGNTPGAVETEVTEVPRPVEEIGQSGQVRRVIAVVSPAVSGLVVPGPEPVRHVVDQYYLADRGQVAGVGRMRQRVRYRAGAIVRATGEALAVTLVLPIVAGLLDRLPPQSSLAVQLAPLQAPLHRVVLLAITAMWILAAIKTTVAVVQALMYSVVFHERGFELATGVLHRRRQFIWYYQLAEEPVYVRTPVMFLTYTASLRVTYDHAATTVRPLELSGIGSPRATEHVRTYLETRRLAERSSMRGSLA